VKWSFGTYLTYTPFTSAPNIVEGSVYIGSWDRHVYSYNLTTGEAQWRVNLGEVVYATPQFVDDVVYVGSQQDGLMALDDVALRVRSVLPPLVSVSAVSDDGLATYTLNVSDLSGFGVTETRLHVNHRL
jgi:outer membrane protein assembly factor BamB